MDKNRTRKMALASGLALKLQADGSHDLNDYIYKLVDMVESAVSHEYEAARYKDQLDLVALRSKVSAQASEIVNLRRLIGGARDILNKEITNG